MIDLETLEEKCKVGIENDVNVEFSVNHLNIHVNGTGYRNKVKIKDGYNNNERSYSLGRNDTIDGVIDKEENIAEKVEKAKELEETTEINGWRQVETSEGVFLKFVNATKSVEIRLNSRDQWTMNSRTKSDIKVAKYDMVVELLSRNPIEEIVNEVAQEELRKWLKNVDGIGRTISRKMASKAKAAATGQMESLDDVRFRRPKNVEYSVTTDAENYFDKLNYDPIKEAVREKKKELVQKHDQTHLVSEAI